MGQTYTPTFNPDDQVFDTMTFAFTNFETIRSAFSGPTSPSSPIAYQWWGSTTDDKLYLRNHNNTDWLEVFDADTGEVEIQPGQITSVMISDAARKGSIVEGENISPASCALRAKVMGLPISTNTNIVTVTEGSWDTIISSRIYIPAGTSFEMYMTAKLANAKARFSVSGTTSTETSSVSTPAWASSEAYLNLSSKSSGWHSFEVQAYGNGSVPTPYFYQMATRVV